MSLMGHAAAGLIPFQIIADITARGNFERARLTDTNRPSSAFHPLAGKISGMNNCPLADCCRCGISVCRIPRPMNEQEIVWHVAKHASFEDRATWKASHTCESIEEVIRWVGAYLAEGTEPIPRAEGRT